MFSYEVGLTLGSVAALVVTILLYIKVMPRKLDGTFDNPWLQRLHDFFHFKKLYLEEVLKFLYVLATVATVCVGVFMLLSYYESWSWSYYGGGHTTKESLFLYGLLMIVGGPISVRLAYEVLMMFILVVKNVIDINNKMPKVGEKPVEYVAPANTCPNCGKELLDGASFCTGCGHKL